jgi:hypothetical protein
MSVVPCLFCHCSRMWTQHFQSSSRDENSVYLAIIQRCGLCFIQLLFKEVNSVYPATVPRYGLCFSRQLSEPWTLLIESLCTVQYTLYFSTWFAWPLFRDADSVFTVQGCELYLPSSGIWVLFAQLRDVDSICPVQGCGLCLPSSEMRTLFAQLKDVDCFSPVQG